MKTRIIGTYVSYDDRDNTLDKVDVNFIINGDIISMNGHIVLTASEYVGNETLEALESIIKNKVLEGVSTWAT